jgi:hypothetical protein
MPDIGNGQYIHPLIAITKLSNLAGRVIDRNQGVAEQSFAWALQLDQELEDLWKKFDPAWLDYTELLADIESNAAELRERIMGQMVFHQIRVYLHLPFMLKAASNSRFSYSRTACLNGSREVLRLYQSLRTGTVQPLYECKAIDFIGFTAAVLVQIGLLNFGTSSQSSATPKEIEDDVRLIEVSIDIFRRASSEKGGKVAAQSAQVLEKMMAKFKGTSTELDGNCQGQSDFVIPYFGTISIKRGGQVVKQGPPPPVRSPSNYKSPAPSSSLYTPTSEKPSSTSNSEFFSNPTTTHSLNITPKTSLSSSSTANTSALNFPTDPGPSPFVSYDGFYNWNNLNAEGDSGTGGGFNSQINDDSMNNFPLPTNNFSWQHMPMDIDQDWSWFLNDAQTTQGVGSAGAAASGSLDAFNAQGFTGFG